MSGLVDSHCHLDDETFPEGVDVALERAKAAGVAAFVCIGVGGSARTQDALRLARRRQDVVATAGVHPHDAATFDVALDADLAIALADDRVVAVGEVGLDYHYDHSPRDVQQRVFRHFVHVARSFTKPLVIHTRSAPDDTLDVLRQEGAREVGGVIHCFSEDRGFARQALDLGFDISFSGILTFKNASSIRDVAAWLPEDRMLVETDSPYLAPAPLRGRRCEPAFVVHTARHLAELRATSLERIIEATTANAVRRFGAGLATCIELRQNTEA